MDKKVKSFIRPTGKWTDIIPIALILTFIIELTGSFLPQLISMVLPIEKIFGLVTDNEIVSDFIYRYFESYGVWIVFTLICAIPKGNRIMIRQLAMNKNTNNYKGIILGLLLGFGLNGLCVFFSVVFKNMHLYYNEFSPLILFTFFVVVFIQSSAEELVCRMYLYQKLRRRYTSPVIAIALNTLFFAAMHLFNDNIHIISIISLIASGLLNSLLIYYYDGLWAAMFCHTAWNFTQSILFGLPNSGVASEYSLFKIDAPSAESGFFYDVGFGIEGSIGAVLVTLIACVIIIIINRGKAERNDVWSVNSRY